MMKKYCVGILLLLVSASAASSFQTPAEWIKYTSPEGRYSVSLPSQPKLRTQEAETADGQKFPQHMASVVEAGDVIFLTAYFDSAPGTIFSADAARDGMLKKINGTLISETEISLSGYPGREFKVVTKPAPGTSSASYVVRARLYEADKRIYVVQFISPQSLESPSLTAKASKYFDSFQLVKE